MLDRGGALVAQMVEQDVRELAARPPPQRVEDHFMLAHRFAPALALAGKIGGIADAPDPAGEIGVSRQQGSVARGLDNFVMDGLVDPEVAVHVAAQIEAVHFVMQPLDPGDLLVGDVFAGETPGKSLQAAHHVKQLAQFALAQLPDARAPVGQQIDQPFRRQNLQGLAQRRAGDPEHGAQLALRHTAAVRDVALHDVVAQAGEDFVVQRGFLAAGGGAGPGFGRQGSGVAGNHGFHGRTIMREGPIVDQKLNAKFS